MGVLEIFFGTTYLIAFSNTNYVLKNVSAMHTLLLSSRNTSKTRSEDALNAFNVSYITLAMRLYSSMPYGENQPYILHSDGTVAMLPNKKGEIFHILHKNLTQSCPKSCLAVHTMKI